MKKMLTLCSGALATLVLSGCASQPPALQAFGEPTDSSMQFACGNGEKVEMQFYPEQGHSVLRRSGWTVDLPKQATDSGYAFSNGPTTVLGKGNELTIQIGHLAPIWCRSNRPMMVAGVK
uniref:C-type lysozyme inhibitor domain-containing protein n=1 Tax=Spumella elongata TaxID=89044 RepID=A0A7S3MHQ3_9STRA|mmetsp:Transcript_64536/g.113968  ORF Transcript_64536/g.113968 Transcript_64536/m.113968 type:complete len:120 (+) Transcript_64536:209-568(+)|eukprot:CAMPEP_0184976132 /NCGR_PEP_ID=MMETSP1098-20130426/7148_1 /TAXON_ID=89044 /ORGANISM="Spumella elongata, Strain CCAP 955/1" /LENGTH=119 /DNA_ID=CAMNT_0027498939 /DNA_START=209 /DNA_END=568 /DNA_ORIENTATION=-